ncbi:hypothetical protein [Nonlabens sp.]|uniref:hypothetical protein n=1 Tax=Nonlabens sp. TaxID=1888209 RepID=UPI001BD17C5E|nr:hypothetical protein [Nonlabens sp.]
MKYKSFISFILVVTLVASLWFISKYKDVYKQEVIFKISFINVPHRLSLDDSSRQLSAPVEISATGFTLIWEKIFGHQVVLDFKENTFLRNDTLYFNPARSVKRMKRSNMLSYEILSADDLDIPIQLTRYKSKKVPVINNIALHYTLNYVAVKKPYFQKDSVTVTGNDSKVEALQELIITRGDQLTIKDSLTTLDINLKQIDPELDFEPQILTLHVEAAQMTEGKINIPVRLLNAPAYQQVKLIPDHVEVVYSIKVANYDQIIPEDISVSINYDLVKELNVAVIPAIEINNDKIISYRTNLKQIQVLTIK